MTAHHYQEEVVATTARRVATMKVATMKVHRREEGDVMEMAQGHGVDVAARGLPVTRSSPGSWRSEKRWWPRRWSVATWWSPLKPV